MFLWLNVLFDVDATGLLDLILCKDCKLTGVSNSSVSYSCLDYFYQICSASLARRRLSLPNRKLQDGTDDDEDGDNSFQDGMSGDEFTSTVTALAADVIKIAMINVADAMKKANLKSKMLLQVHDELVFDVENSEIEQLQQIVKENMESAVKLVVPLDIEQKVAKDWLEAH